MDWRERIEVNPEILAGKPVVKGTRVSVIQVVDLLSQGWTVEDLLANFPRLSEAGVRACLAYAREILEQETVFPLAG